MTAYKQTAKSIATFIASSKVIPVAKLPIREMVTKCIPGEKYFCTDTGMESVAKEGECLITREYPDGTKDTYKNKKGPKYEFEGGKTWETLQPGESAWGKLKDGPEYDRFALLAQPEDTVDAVWDETQKVLRSNAYITVIYADKPFNMEGDNKWGSRQFVLNNNAGDIHPIDVQRKDKNGNPVVIGELPLTAKPEARKAELQEHVKKYYGGEMPEHLLPLLKMINKELANAVKKVTTKLSFKSSISPSRPKTPKQR